MACIWLIFWLSFFTMINCELKIQRNDYRYIQNAYYFYHSSDYFTNPTNEEEFCKNRNAVCRVGSSKCFRCYCQGSNFISYKDGCLSYDQAIKHLKGSSCMHISNPVTIPLVCDMYRYNCYHKIYLPGNLAPSSIGKCTPTHLILYDMKYGKESFAPASFTSKFRITKESNYFCLKCDKYELTCPYSPGRLQKLSMSCSILNGNKTTLETCFIFSTRGNYNEGIAKDALILWAKHGHIQSQYLSGNPFCKEYANKSCSDLSGFVLIGRITTRPPKVSEGKKGSLLIKRKKLYILKDKDSFTNQDNQSEFCEEFGASCNDTSCSSCMCSNRMDTFVAYRYGCLNTEISNVVLHVGSYLSSTLQTKSIALIQPEYFKYGSCFNLKIPQNIDGSLCVVNSTKYINEMTGEEEVILANPFSMYFSSIWENQLCLQCNSFRCNLSRYSGMLLRIGIQCKTNETSQRTLDTSFTFTMDGERSFNETKKTDGIQINEQKGSVEILRNTTSLGKDVFTNPIGFESLCEKYKSTCHNLNCSKCRCYDSTTFISYTHGCMNSTEKVNDWMGSNLTLLKSNSFIRKRCIYLQKPLEYNTNWTCKINSMTYMEPISGEEVDFSFTQIPFKISSSMAKKRLDKFCLQCDLYNCDVSFLSGKIFKLGIQCQNQTVTWHSSEAFVMEGYFAVNRSYPFFKEKHTDSTERARDTILDTGINDSMVIGGSVAGCAVIVVLALVFFVACRKSDKNDNSKRTFNKIDSSIELSEKQMQQDHGAEEYASIGACSSQRNLNEKQKFDANQRKERHSNKSGEERTVDSNPLYSATNLAIDNHDVGPEYSVLEEEVYAEATQSKMTGNIRTEDSLYAEADNPMSLPYQGNVENILANDGVNNPIYGVDGCAEYSSVISNSNSSQENQLYGNTSTILRNEELTTTTSDNEYAVVMKEKKTKIYNNYNRDNRAYIPEPNNYYSVGDTIKMC